MPAAAGARLATVLLLALWILPGEVQAAEPEPPLVLERTIPLPGVAGRIDHMAVDLRRGRLLVAELGNGSVDVVDLAKGKAVRRITGLKEPQGVGYAPETDLVAVASAGDGSVRLFQGEDLSPVGVVSLGEDADNVRLDARTGRFVVGYGSGGLAAFDPASRSVVSRVALPAHPEGFQLDPNTGRAYVNVPDAGQVAVVEFAAGKQIANWRVPGGLRQNFPMALDAAGSVLATVFRSPARLVLLDTKTGAVAANLPTCGDADDVFFDAKRRRLTVSCGEGTVDVVQRNAAGYQPLARVRTRPGARTSLFVPELDRLFVAARASPAGTDAAILVFRPAP
jgi:DNA-binding beta-propeller fold protein YncE